MLSSPRVRRQGMVITLVIGLCAAIVTLFAQVWIERELDRPLMTKGSSDIIQVPRGASLHHVVNRLVSAYQLPYPRIVVEWARWHNLDRSLKAGEYRVSDTMSVRELLHKITRGEVVSYQVTIPEGITFKQALELIWAQEPVRAVLEGEADQRLLALVSPSSSVEGWLLPETYQYVRGDTDLAIVQRAHEAMRQALRSAWEARQLDSPLASEYEALILASIVERETSVESERPVIAGVFTRRLQRNMRLQTDPTVIYGLGPAFDGNLTRRHLRDETNAFNTYRVKGLPPTPIALPGIDAIRAAVQPVHGDALYFVAKGDGTHVFSATLEEHNANVRQYQMNRRANYRSTPGHDP